MYEEQITAYLSTFHVPADYGDQMLAPYAQAQASRSDEAARRRQIETPLQRIKELYSWGDLDAESCRRERDQLLAELAGLRGAEEQQAVLERTAAFLADLSAAWAAANQEQTSWHGCCSRRSRSKTNGSWRSHHDPNSRPSLCSTGASVKKVNRCGSDGIRTRDLGLDRAAC